MSILGWRAKSFDTFYEARQEMFRFRVLEFADEISNLSGSFFSNDGNRIRAEFEQNWNHIGKDSLRFINFKDVTKLFSNTLSDSPFLLIFLELNENPYQRLSFIATENSHEFWHVSDCPYLDIIAFVLEKYINHSEKIFLSQFFSYQFCDFMNTFTQGLFDLFIVCFEKFFIDLP